MHMKWSQPEMSTSANGCFCTSNHKVSNSILGICWPLLNQKHDVEWFLLRSFVDLVRIYFLLIISRNHSNTVKYYSKGYLFWYQYFDIYRGCCPLNDVYFNDMQISGKIFKINDTFLQYISKWLLLKFVVYLLCSGLQL